MPLYMQQIEVMEQELAGRRRGLHFWRSIHKHKVQEYKGKKYLHI